MKAVVRGEAPHGTADNTVDLLTVRYEAAFDAHQSILDRNSYAILNGSKPSDQSELDEERAFEALQRARHALLVAAERAYPTIH